VKIVGLDLSLTSTGIAVIQGDDVRLDRVRSVGRKDATLQQRNTRLGSIVGGLIQSLTDNGTRPDLVVIEGPSYGQHRQGGQHDRAGLWWAVVSVHLDKGVPVVEVPPATRSKYATGKGNAAKDHVLASVVRRYPGVIVDGNDTADALVLAAMGARHLGQPIEASLPQANLAAMDAVAWPQEVPA
jgi:Holliday junction resolvasome RuvABC endonuclease subunit